MAKMGSRKHSLIIDKKNKNTAMDAFTKGLARGLGLDSYGDKIFQEIIRENAIPKDRLVNRPLTKAEKELGGYWLLDHLDSKERLPNLKKIAKYAENHPYKDVQKAALQFQKKYGNAPLNKTWFAGQNTMLPKDKAGYIKAHRNVMEKIHEYKYVTGGKPPYKDAYWESGYWVDPKTNLPRNYSRKIGNEIWEERFFRNPKGKIDSRFFVIGKKK